ncbi:gfo/Idh/MocA family oxidoreductase, partial [Campylobacter coli]|nr:gfo/Idh/MocA family oxidoreductase [Campylobacter coli]
MKVLIIGFGSIGKKHFLALNELRFLVDVLSKSYE